MDYLSFFREIVKVANDQERPRNQLLSDLNLFASELKDNVKSYKKFMEDIRSSGNSLNDQNIYIALEYNNALHLSSLRPDNFMDLLKKAAEEKRYYFFFTASEMLMGAKINPRLKTELQLYVNHIKGELGLSLEDVESDVYKEIIVIVNKILEIALEDFYLFRTISIKVIDPYIETHDYHSSRSTGDITLNNLKTLYGEIMHYSNALGINKGE